MWIGTEKGLDLMNKKEGTFQHFQHDPHDPNSLVTNYIRDIIESDDGKLWIGTNTILDIFDTASQTFTHIGSEHNMNGEVLRSLLKDSQGNIWVSSWTNGLYYWEKSSEEKITFKAFLHEQDNPNSLIFNRLQALGEDSQGNIWIGTENGGMDIYSPSTQTFKHFRADNGDEGGISSNSIWCIYEDNSKRIWLGTFDKGLNIYDPFYRKFNHIKQIPFDQNSLSSNSISSFVEDQSSNLWIGTDGGGLNYYDIQKNIFSAYTQTNSNISSNAILTITKDENNHIWMGTWAGGLCKLDPETEKFTSYQNPSKLRGSTNIFDIITDPQGNLILGTYGGGLDYFNPKDETFTQYLANPEEANSLVSDTIYSLLMSRKGELWVATLNGLSRVNRDDTGNLNFKKYRHIEGDSTSLSTNGLFSLYEDVKGNIWIGTQGGGLNIMDIDKETFRVFKKEDGLPNNDIRAIIEDDNGDIWMTTNKGVSKMHIHFEGEQLHVNFRNFNISDGLQGDEFFKNSMYKASDGKIYMGGVNGFNTFYPKDVFDNPSIPEIHLTDFKIFNQTVAIGKDNSPLDRHIDNTKEITLSYLQSVITINYVALNYTHPDRNQYAFMLEGFDKDWNYVGDRQTATYTNLDDGDYTFKVKGSNNDGVWNEEGVALKIKVTPPFWDTLWFKALVLIIILGSGVAYYQIRMMTIKQQKQKLEVQVATRTEDLKKANSSLQEKNKEVHEANKNLNVMNEEIKQQAEELQMQRDYLEENNTLIVTKNNHITSSINAALSIQKAILPTEQTMKDLFLSLIHI